MTTFNEMKDQSPEMCCCFCGTTAPDLEHVCLFIDWEAVEGSELAFGELEENTTEGSVLCSGCRSWLEKKARVGMLSVERVREADADLAEISRITLDEDPVQGVRNMNKLRKGQGEILARMSEILKSVKGMVSVEDACEAVKAGSHGNREVCNCVRCVWTMKAVAALRKLGERK